MIRDERLRAHLAAIERTVESVTPEADLRRKLEAFERGERGPLRVKLGIDPTSPTVHVGNGIPLANLRWFQDRGHQAVLILGDATALVGDPSGKDKTRPMLTPEQVEANLSTWLGQVSKVLDLSKAEVRRNGEWFRPMRFEEVLRLADRMTVQQMLERDAFQRRFEERAPISIREFLYCLMQGWDSVVVRADVELGGTDQTFNLNVGRRLMEQEGLEPQVCLVSPLVEGTDGQAKMSKSLGNAIGVADPPHDMFGKAMRVSDALLPKYLRLLTDLPDAEVERLLALPNPRDAKLAMAHAVVRRYHGRAAADGARDEFVRVISRGEVPTDVREAEVGPDEQPVWRILVAAGLAPSTSEARRKIGEGAVRLHRGDDEPVVADVATAWRPRSGDLVRLGRHWVRLRVAGPA